jgi:phosphopantetheinyl transferase
MMAVGITAPVTADLAVEPLFAELQAGPPIEVAGADATVWLFTRAHCGPRHVARHDARAVSRVLLRHLLSHVADDGTDPTEWRFERGHCGKPRLAPECNAQLQFNVSYGTDALVVAISRSHVIGVDLESAVPTATATIPWQELCERERALLLRLPAEKRYAKFVRMWTLKEAFTKCLGVGATVAFEQVETALAPPRVTSRPSDGARGRSFQFHQQRIDAGRGEHVLALAACMGPAIAG